MRYRWTPKAHQIYNFRNCTLAHFLGKNSEISPKIDDFSSYAKILIQEKYQNARSRPPYKGSTVHPSVLIGKKLGAKTHFPGLSQCISGKD